MITNKKLVLENVGKKNALFSPKKKKVVSNVLKIDWTGRFDRLDRESATKSIRFKV